MAFVRPRLELFDDPGELADRRVVQPVGDGLGPGCLDLEVAVLLAEEPLHLLDPSPFDVAQRGQVGGVQRSGWDEPHGRGVDVHAEHPIGVDPSEVGSDERSEVAALDSVALVAET